MPKAGSTTWVYNMLILTESHLVNNSSTGRQPSSTVPLSAHQSSERGPERLQAPEKSETRLSEDDLMHEELRRHYPVPKNLDEVEKQALTFHVVSLKEMLVVVTSDQICEGGCGEGGGSEGVSVGGGGGQGGRWLQ